MNTILKQISGDWIEAIGWMMLHSLWQGLLIALLMTIAFRTFRQSGPRIKYALANISLMLFFFLSVFTFIHYLNTEPEIVFLEQSAVETTITPALQTGVMSSALEGASSFLRENIRVITLLWLAGFLFLSLRLVGSFAYIQYLKFNQTEPLGAFWDAKIAALQYRMGLKKHVEVLESALVNLPLVIGFFKPVILLPVGAVNHLTPAQAEAVLAHELAHIYRDDFILNLLQSVIETIFYFNPAVWWISANIRTERENCCDDMAISICDNSLEYAKALLTLQTATLTPPALALPFGGQKKQLLNRVKRILNQPQNKSNIMEKLTTTCLLLTALGILTLSAGTLSGNDHTSKDPLCAPSVWAPHSPIRDVPFFSDTLPKPPSPATPPIAPKLPRSYTKVIRKTKDENGKIHIHIESLTKTDNLEIVITEDNEIQIEGEEIKEGDIAIIIDELKGSAPHLQFFPEYDLHLPEMKDLAFAPDAMMLTKEFMARKHLDLEKIKEAKIRIHQEWHEKHLDNVKKREQITLKMEKAARERERAVRKMEKGLSMRLDKYNLRNEFEHQLLSDQLIKNTADYNFKLTSKKLVVNGKKQPHAVWQKYKSLYEEITGFDLKKYEIKIGA